MLLFLLLSLLIQIRYEAQQQQLSQKKMISHDITQKITNNPSRPHEITEQDKKEQDLKQKIKNMKERLLAKDKPCDKCKQMEDNLKTKVKQNSQFLKQIHRLKFQIEELTKNKSINQNISKNSINQRLIKTEFMTASPKNGLKQPNKMFLKQSYTFTNQIQQEQIKLQQIEQKAKVLKNKQKKERVLLKKIKTKNVSNVQISSKSKSSIFFAQNNSNKDILNGKQQKCQPMHCEHQKIQRLIEEKHQALPKERQLNFMIQTQQQHSFEQEQSDCSFENNLKNQIENLKQYGQIKFTDISQLQAISCGEQNSQNIVKLQKQNQIKIEKLKSQNNELKKENQQLKLKQQDYLQIIKNKDEEKKDLLNQLTFQTSEKEKLRVENLGIEQELKNIKLDKIQTQQKMTQELSIIANTAYKQKNTLQHQLYQKQNELKNKDIQFNEAVVKLKSKSQNIQALQQINKQLNDSFKKIQLRCNFLEQNFTQKILQLDQAINSKNQLQRKYDDQLLQLQQQLKRLKNININLQASIIEKQHKLLDLQVNTVSLDHKITLLEQQMLLKEEERKNINRCFNQKQQQYKKLQRINLELIDKNMQLQQISSLGNNKKQKQSSFPQIQKQKTQRQQILNIHKIIDQQTVKQGKILKIRTEESEQEISPQKYKSNSSLEGISKNTSNSSKYITHGSPLNSDQKQQNLPIQTLVKAFKTPNSNQAHVDDKKIQQQNISKSQRKDGFQDINSGKEEFISYSWNQITGHAQKKEDNQSQIMSSMSNISASANQKYYKQKMRKTQMMAKLKKKK